MVVVATYSFPLEAHIGKSSLECAGIKSFLADEHIVNTQWLYSDAIGGVRLFVSVDDYEEAIKILNDDFSNSLEKQFVLSGEKLDICPHCSSPNLLPHTQGKRPAFLVFLLLGFPLFPYKQGYRCNQCGEFSEKL